MAGVVPPPPCRCCCAACCCAAAGCCRPGLASPGRSISSRGGVVVRMMNSTVSKSRAPTMHTSPTASGCMGGGREGAGENMRALVSGGGRARAQGTAVSGSSAMLPLAGSAARASMQRLRFNLWPAPQTTRPLEGLLPRTHKQPAASVEVHSQGVAKCVERPHHHHNVQPKRNLLPERPQPALLPRPLRPLLRAQGSAEQSSRGGAVTDCCACRCVAWRRVALPPPVSSMSGSWVG